MNEEVQRAFVVGKVKVHFTYDFLQDDSGRMMTICVLESYPHIFHSGVAVRSPREVGCDTVLQGWKISLKRACGAAGDWMFGHVVYKHLWHEIRKQLREEKNNGQATS